MIIPKDQRNKHLGNGGSMTSRKDPSLTNVYSSADAASGMSLTEDADDGIVQKKDASSSDAGRVRKSKCRSNRRGGHTNVSSKRTNVEHSSRFACPMRLRA